MNSVHFSPLIPRETANTARDSDAQRAYIAILQGSDVFKKEYIDYSQDHFQHLCYQSVLKSHCPKMYSKLRRARKVTRSRVQRAIASNDVPSSNPLIASRPIHTYSDASAAVAALDLDVQVAKAVFFEFYKKVMKNKTSSSTQFQTTQTQQDRVSALDGCESTIKHRTARAFEDLHELDTRQHKMRLKLEMLQKEYEHMKDNRR